MIRIGARRPRQEGRAQGTTRRLLAAAAAPVVAATLLAPAVQGATPDAAPSHQVAAGDTVQAAARARSAYTRSVLRDRPAALLVGLQDVTGKGRSGSAVGRPGRTRMPNGDPAVVFNGRNQYLSFANRRAFSIATTGALTVEFWMRPDRLQFTRSEGSGYVYVLGKGRPGAHEWYGRMYSKVNAEGRPNRISGYAFNPSGGLGAGSYFQDKVVRGRWIHVALVFNSRARSSGYPTGHVRIYRNGVLRDRDSLADYGIVPRRGPAPLRVGTGYLGSFFQGAVGGVAFFNRELGPTRIRAHYLAGRSR